MRRPNTLIPIFTCITLILALAVPAFSKIVYVSKGGSNSDGLSWLTARRTVNSGLAAAVSGDEVWVAAGTYVEKITLKTVVAIYGGFAGNETARDQRNWRTNVTILDGNDDGCVVSCLPNQSASTRIDGFTIRNGYGSKAGGIDCSDLSSSPTIANNIVRDNRGKGIFLEGVSPSYPSSPCITNNIICGNSGAGIYSFPYCHPTIVGNTIIANGGGLYLAFSNAAVSNNIVAFNSMGITNQPGTPNTPAGAPVLRNNCVYGNKAYNYSGLSAGTGDISVEPQLTSVVYPDFHLQPNSPCVNTGYDAAVVAGSLDMDSQSRIDGVHVDIGADESYGETWTITPRIVRVAPTGNDSNDGSSWSLAKKTVQAGLDAASLQGGEVWVKAGLYKERVTLRPYSYLYGGFSGSETERSQRDWSANVSILDGQQGGTVVTCWHGYMCTSIDGFVIRNGKTTTTVGAAIWCRVSTTISNNRITGNAVAIWCSSCSPVIVTSLRAMGGMASGATAVHP